MIFEPIKRFLQGKKANKRAHDIRNDMTREILDLRVQAKDIRYETRDLRDKIRQTTAYRIAEATGRLK